MNLDAVDAVEKNGLQLRSADGIDRRIKGIARCVGRKTTSITRGDAPPIATAGENSDVVPNLAGSVVVASKRRRRCEAIPISKRNIGWQCNRTRNLKLIIENRSNCQAEGNIIAKCILERDVPVGRLGCIDKRQSNSFRERPHRHQSERRHR